MGDVVAFRLRSLYEAKSFKASTIYGEFEASGTLCGHVDLVTPHRETLTISVDEAMAIVLMLQSAMEDVLTNANPSSDPRIYE